MIGRPGPEWKLIWFLAGELQKLQEKLKRIKKEAFARGTTKNLEAQWRTFLLLCVYFQFNPVPAMIECVCLFAQFLSRSSKAVPSIQNYISGVRMLHALLDVPLPGTDNIELKLPLKGLKQLKPHANRQAAPLSPNILCRILGLLDLSAPFDATLWVILSLAFSRCSESQT